MFHPYPPAYYMNFNIFDMINSFPNVIMNKHCHCFTLKNVSKYRHSVNAIPLLPLYRYALVYLQKVLGLPHISSLTMVYTNTLCHISFSTYILKHRKVKKKINTL